MALKANVGVSRKVADNNYGSRGASVNVEVELESALVNEPERFFDRIRQVFRLTQQSIDEELTRQQAGCTNHSANRVNNGSNGNGYTDNGHAAPSGNGNSNGRTNGYSNGNGRANANGRKATASQVRAIHAIAKRQGLDLAQTLHDRYGTNQPEDLSITEASQLIDDLKCTTTGNGKGQR